MRGLTVGLVTAAIGLGFAAGAQAQLVEVRRPRVYLGISGSLARPVGEFQRFVDWGGGVDLYGFFALDQRRTLGVRAEGSPLIYGHEGFSVPGVVPRVGSVNINTNNIIFGFGVGPQLTFDLDALKPYVFGTLGFSYFATISSITDGGAEIASETNYDDFTPALRVGAGMLMSLTNGQHPVSLDFSVQSTYNGEAEYLRRGGVRDNPDGSISVLPIQSDANLLTFRVGVAVGL